MNMRRLSTRGPNAKLPAKLPALQAVRSNASAAEVAQAIERLREWVEARLGTRGDPAERAATMRDLAQQMEPIQAFIEKLRDFDGSAETLRATPVAALPDAVKVGSLLFLSDGSVIAGTAAGWKKLTLTDP